MSSHTVASGQVHVLWMYGLYWAAFERGDTEAAWDILNVLASAAVPEEGLCRMRAHQCVAHATAECLQQHVHTHTCAVSKSIYARTCHARMQKCIHACTPPQVRARA